MKYWPALDVPRPCELDLLFATLDDFAPTAAEEHESTVRLFFSSSRNRDDARARLDVDGTAASVVDVPDEDWARRSQESLSPVTIGRITIAPPWAITSPSPLTIVIQPSMGFGTGHHATTRLCLAALQTLDLVGVDALDIGTGSGVLAIAARRLGARRAVGIDCDSDAIQSAKENLELNPTVDEVSFEIADLASTSTALPQASVVTANLTGALLQRSAARILGAVRPGGSLIVSGVMTSERSAVVAAFSAPLLSEADEDGWLGLTFQRGQTGVSPHLK